MNEKQADREAEKKTPKKETEKQRETEDRKKAGKKKKIGKEYEMKTASKIEREKDRKRERKERKKKREKKGRKKEEVVTAPGRQLPPRSPDHSAEIPPLAFRWAGMLILEGSMPTDLSVWLLGWNCSHLFKFHLGEWADGYFAN